MYFHYDEAKVGERLEPEDNEPSRPRERERVANGSKYQTAARDRCNPAAAWTRCEGDSKRLYVFQ